MDFIDFIFEGTQYENSELIKNIIRSNLNINKTTIDLIKQLTPKNKKSNDNI